MFNYVPNVLRNVPNVLHSERDQRLR